MPPIGPGYLCHPNRALPFAVAFIINVSDRFSDLQDRRMQFKTRKTVRPTHAHTRAPTHAVARFAQVSKPEMDKLRQFLQATSDTTKSE